MSPFEQWAVNQSLILISDLTSWKRSESYCFEECLMRNIQSINEGHWLDALCDVEKSYPIVSLTSRSRYSVDQESTDAIFLSGHNIFLLEEDPVIVVGMLDPFKIKEASGVLEQRYPWKKVVIVLVSPHAMASLKAQCIEAKDLPNRIFVGDTKSWGKLLGIGFDGLSSYRNIIMSLWSGKPIAAFFPDGDIDYAAPIEGIANALIIRKTARRAWICTSRGWDQNLAEEVLQRTGLQPILFSCTPEEINRLSALAATSSSHYNSPSLHVEKWDINLGDENALFLCILKEAIDRGASDIHFDPKPTRIRIRFRINGSLYEQPPLNRATYSPLIRRAKINSAMQQNIIGQIQSGAGHIVHRDRRYDLRYEVGLLEAGDESLVIRIFSSEIHRINDLNLTSSTLSALHWFLDQSEGMLVISGPTGSGKTSTLYALLSELATPDTSVITIENPVEKHFEPARQISVNNTEELHAALRSVLRQDPDVILIGEVRDQDTARIAIQAALTGHKVLTTLHANNAIGVIERFCGSYGIDRSSLAQAMKLSLAQRLVPRLCRVCRIEREPVSSELEIIPHIDICSPVVSDRSRCSACRDTGIAFRSIITETFPVDHAASRLIASGIDIQEIENYNRGRGYQSLLHQASSLYLTGEIEGKIARQFAVCPVD